MRPRGVAKDELGTLKSSKVVDGAVRSLNGVVVGFDLAEVPLPAVLAEGVRGYRVRRVLQRRPSVGEQVEMAVRVNPLMWAQQRICEIA